MKTKLLQNTNGVYTNISDMNKLCDICLRATKKENYLRRIKLGGDYYANIYN